jgi:hypothetical protein
MKLRLKNYNYKGPPNKNPYYPLEKRELHSIFGLWIMWGLNGNRHISPQSLFSLDESLSSLDAHLNFDRTRYLAIVSSLRFDMFTNRSKSIKDAPISEVRYI